MHGIELLNVRILSRFNSRFVAGGIWKVRGPEEVGKHS